MTDEDGEWHTVRRRPRKSNAGLKRQLVIPASKIGFALLEGVSEDPFMFKESRKSAKPGSPPSLPKGTRDGGKNNLQAKQQVMYTNPSTKSKPSSVATVSSAENVTTKVHSFAQQGKSKNAKTPTASSNFATATKIRASVPDASSSPSSSSCGARSAPGEKRRFDSPSSPPSHSLGSSAPRKMKRPGQPPSARMAAVAAAVAAFPSLVASWVAVLLGFIFSPVLALLRLLRIIGNGVREPGPCRAFIPPKSEGDQSRGALTTVTAAAAERKKEGTTNEVIGHEDDESKAKNKTASKASGARYAGNDDSKVEEDENAKEPQDKPLVLEESSNEASRAESKAERKAESKTESKELGSMAKSSNTAGFDEAKHHAPAKSAPPLSQSAEEKKKSEDRGDAATGHGEEASRTNDDDDLSVDVAPSTGDPALLAIAPIYPWIQGHFLTAHPDVDDDGDGGSDVDGEDDGGSGDDGTEESPDDEDGSLVEAGSRSSAAATPPGPKSPWTKEAHASCPVSAVALVSPTSIISYSSSSSSSNSSAPSKHSSPLSSGSSPPPPCRDAGASPLVISTGHDCRVRIWKWVDGSNLTTESGSSVSTTGSCSNFTGLGKSRPTKASSSSSSSSSLVSSSCLKPVRALQGHTGRIEALCVEPAVVALARGAASTERLFVTAGRDSMFKVWTLGEASNGAAAKEISSFYVFESIRCAAVRWDFPSSSTSSSSSISLLPAASATSAGRGDLDSKSAAKAPRTSSLKPKGIAALGCRSGAILLFDLASGRKIQTLKGHTEEVTCLTWLGDMSYNSDESKASGGALAASAVTRSAALDRILVSGGGRDKTVRIWDLRTILGERETVSGSVGSKGSTAKKSIADSTPRVDVISGFEGRVCSMHVDEATLRLYVGDYSSSLKVVPDLRDASPIVAEVLRQERKRNSITTNGPVPALPSNGSGNPESSGNFGNSEKSGIPSCASGSPVGQSKECLFERVPNALSFAGDESPVAGLWVARPTRKLTGNSNASDNNVKNGMSKTHDSSTRSASSSVGVASASAVRISNTDNKAAPPPSVLVTSSIAWLTDDSAVLEEADESEQLPTAFLNLHAVDIDIRGSHSATATLDPSSGVSEIGSSGSKRTEFDACKPEGATNARDGKTGSGLPVRYLSSLRLARGVVTCVSGEAELGRMVVGGSTGWVVGLRTFLGEGRPGEATDAVGHGYGVDIIHGLDIGLESFVSDQDPSP